MRCSLIISAVRICVCIVVFRTLFTTEQFVAEPQYLLRVLFPAAPQDPFVKRISARARRREGEHVL